MSKITIQGDNSPAGILRHWERKTKTDCAREILRCWTERDTLRQQLTTAQAENEALRARVAELEATVRLAEDNAVYDDPDVWGEIDRVMSVSNSNSFILRKQAEKLDEIARFVKEADCDGLATVASIYEGLVLNSSSLRQQADELEKAGGEQ